MLYTKHHGRTRDMSPRYPIRDIHKLASARSPTCLEGVDKVYLDSLRGNKERQKELDLEIRIHVPKEQ